MPGRLSTWLPRLALAVGCSAVLAVLLAQARAWPATSTHECGLPDTRPLWIEYGEGSVPPEVRAVFSRPGVVVAASGTNITRDYRAKGAATTYFVLNLPRFVGEPAEPEDPATMQAVADNLFAAAVASTACPTPRIALNELLAPQAATPWTPTNAQYRGNILALVQRLAERGARPVLLVHGDPSVAGDAATWWRSVATAAEIVYEAYYNARNIDRLGPIVGPRRMRLGMRSIVRRFNGIGIARDRLGFMLGFQVALGASGREGLQPRESWFRVVKWEALAARQVAADEGTSSIWSWGWGTFGPASTDPDKPTTACVYLWTRDPTLCDAPTAAGPGFDLSLAEGPINLAPGVECSFPGGAVTTAAIEELTPLTGDRRLALTALFARETLRTRVAVSQAEIDRTEREVVKRVFRGSLAAYLRELKRRHATRAVAKGVIADELRRRLIAQSPTPLLWAADIGVAAVREATCLRDEVPGVGDFPRSDEREIGVAPLPSYLPFLFVDRTPPAAPSGVTAAPATGGVTVDWADASESDAIGYAVYRAPAPAGPYKQVTLGIFPRSTYFDAAAPPGVASYYFVRVVDSSHNLSKLSAAASATPG